VRIALIPEWIIELDYFVESLLDDETLDPETFDLDDDPLA
jgi:hypothetical protein